MEYSQIIYQTDNSLLAYDEVNDLYYVVIVYDDKKENELFIYRTFKNAKMKYEKKIIKVNGLYKQTGKEKE